MCSSDLYECKLSGTVESMVCAFQQGLWVDAGLGYNNVRQPGGDVCGTGAYTTAGFQCGSKCAGLVGTQRANDAGAGDNNFVHRT